MSSSTRHPPIDPNPACAFCGRTHSDDVRIVRSSAHPEAAICNVCLTHLERAMRPEIGTRLSHPPAPSPSYTYPLAGMPVPYYHRLLRVIPLLRAHQHGAFELTVVALEVYSESCLLVLWVQAVPKEVDLAVVQPLAWVTLALADDQGTEYTSGHVVSTTNVGPGYYHGRVEYQFTPTLNPAARELQVSVPELRWEYREADTSDGPGRLLWGEELPPWSFTLELPPQTA
jgi:hypothetical protein